MVAKRINPNTAGEQVVRMHDNHGLDAFGRLRVSNLITMFDSKLLHDKDPEIWAEKLGGGGTSTHDANNANVEMEVTTTGDSVIRQTRQRMNYNPGRSHLVKMTFVLADTVNANAESRVGYYDDNNGFYLSLDGSTLQLVRRKNGVDVETVTQANWNQDTLDGSADDSNPSGLTIDPTKMQILVFDMQWLGAGRARVAFNINGQTVPVHYFNHANIIAAPYITNPNLPMRYEVISTGGARVMHHICSECSGEGITWPTGHTHSVDREHTARQLSSGAATIYPLISLRLASTHLNAQATPLYARVFADSAADFRVVVLFNPTIGGTDAASWVAADDGVEYDITRSAANVLSGGYKIFSDYVFGSNQAQAASDPKVFESQLRLGADVDGNRDEIVVGVSVITGTNVNFYATLGYRAAL